jgi:YaaC-like Protein
MAGRVYHGIHCSLNNIAVLDTQINFNVGNNQTSTFQELIRLLGGDTAVLATPMRLGDVAPQILTGHRLWCNAASASERFLSIDWFRLYHSPSNKNVWIMLDLTKSNFSELNLSVQDMLTYAGLVEYEEVSTRRDYPHIRVRQRTAAPYISDPEETLRTIIPPIRNSIWETVRFGSPYRKYYIYCSPPTERRARLPQIASIYLLMFILSYITRYDPGTFDDLLDSDYGPFIATFISESPMQFLYLLSSEIMGREVSKPAII